MRQEVRRGRKFVEFHDPETQDEFTFTQEISGADVSYQETDGSWHPADENWATDGVDGFVLKNDKLNHKIRLKGTSGRTWYPRRNVNTEYMTFGVPQYWNGKRWANFGFSGWSVDGKTITLQTRQSVTILVHNRWNGIKIDWVLASSAAPSRMRYPVALTGITEIAGVLFGADGVELGRLTPTTATDVNGVELVCSGSFASGYVEFQADVSSATFPVTIDPDFAGGTGDGHINGSNATYSTAHTTSATSTFTGNYMWVGQRYTATPLYEVYRGYLLFDTSSIGADSTVTQANLRMVSILDWSDTDFDIQIVKQAWTGTREENFDGCLAGTADDNIWRNTSGMSTNTQYTSGNLATAWVSKTGTTYYSLRSSRDLNADTPTGSEMIRLATADHATESYRPVLTVTYTSGGALRRTNMNAQMSNLTGGMHG